MIIPEYINFTHQELLADEFFINSHLYPTMDSRNFWNELREKSSAFSREIDIATSMIQSIPYRNNKLTDKEVTVLFSRVQKTIQKEYRKKYRWLYLSMGAAAGITLIFLLNYFNNSPEAILLTGIEVMEKPALPVTQIQLIDNNNNELIIDSDEAVIVHDKHGTLSINSKTMEKTPEKTVTRYNQLLIPPGKRSFLALSDGTKVWVNADTRVVYPHKFDKDRREIYVEGEVFLEIAPDNSTLFYVKTRDLQIKVSGTSFNVSAYNEDPDISVVLVTGKVTVDTKNKLNKTLLPNELLCFDNGEITIRTINVNNYISWRNGVYTFESEMFPVILKKLSRYYHKEIVWTEEVKQLICGGSLNLKDNFFELMDKLAITVPVTYRVNEERIEIDVIP